MSNVYKNNPNLALKKIHQALNEFQMEVKGEPENTNFYKDELQLTYYIIRDIIKSVEQED